MIVVVVLTEMIGDSAGLGFYIHQLEHALRRLFHVYAAIFLIGIIGLTLDFLLLMLRRHFVYWAERRIIQVHNSTASAPRPANDGSLSTTDSGRKIDLNIIPDEPRRIYRERTKRPARRYCATLQIEPGEMAWTMKRCAGAAALREIGAFMRTDAFCSEETITIANNDEMNAVHRHADNPALVERFEIAGREPSVPAYLTGGSATEIASAHMGIAKHLLAGAKTGRHGRFPNR